MAHNCKVTGRVEPFKEATFLPPGAEYIGEVLFGSQSRNPIYHEILSKMKTLHENKSHDYAQDSNVFSNFEIAGNLASHFKDPVDNSFVNLIGVKIARLSELLSGKTPKNESIEDTFIDLANYCAIWGSYRIKRARFIDDFVKKTRDEVK